MNDDFLNDFLLEAFPNPERKGCPDDETLKALAEDRLPAGNPALQHVASCSECYREYRHYRQDWKGSSEGVAAKPALPSEPIRVVPQKNQNVSRPAVRWWAIAAGLAVILGSSGYIGLVHHRTVPSPGLIASNAGAVNANVDLFKAVTIRGGGDESTPLEQVSLPSSIVHLAVTLPRFSQSGPYEILVSKDRAGKTVVARGLGNAVGAGEKVNLAVTLDLRNTPPGAYFLATVRGSDNGTYYYPLKVR